MYCEIFRNDVSQLKKKITDEDTIAEQTENSLISQSSQLPQKWPINHIPIIQDAFIIKSELGKGTFGQVLLASLKRCPESLYALKHIRPITSPHRIASEIKCLTLLRSCDNVISIETFVHYKGHTVLVMPFIEHDKFKDYVSSLTLYEVQDYMKALFMALVATHELGIIHHDIKPSNCLYNCKERKFKLIDFGLAQSKQELQTTGKSCDVSASLKWLSSVNDNKCKHSTTDVCSTCCNRPAQVTPRSGTPGFRAPEVLLKYPSQTTAIDIWSAGVIFLCLLSGKYPFFRASNDNVAIMEIASLFGTERCIKVAKLLCREFVCSAACYPQSLASVCECLRRSLSKEKYYGSKLEKKVPDNTPKILHFIDSDGSINFKPTVFFSSSVSIEPHRDTSNFAPVVAYDLLEKCLDLNPFTRITASQALQHPFFNQ